MAGVATNTAGVLPAVREDQARRMRISAMQLMSRWPEVPRTTLRRENGRRIPVLSGAVSWTTESSLRQVPYR